jgi:murein DD-endopeptidase MepM/ murein hydrolase activator NlpD
VERPNRSPKKKSGMAGLLLELTIQISVILAFVFVTTVQAPRLSALLSEHPEAFVHAAERTAAYFALTPQVYPESIKIHLDPETMKTLGSTGIAGPVPDLIAGALSENIKPSDMLGFVEIESSMCANQGTGIAIDEAKGRLATAKPGEVSWWQGNVDALHSIATALGLDVDSIMGSKGAGAISCTQVMPVNWTNLGGKDYRDAYESAVIAGRYLNANGYQKNPDRAFASYNPGAGQPYIDSVKAAAGRWQQKLASIEFDGKSVPLVEIETATKPSPSVLAIATVYMEMLNKELNGGDQIVTAADVPQLNGLTFVQPYPGSTPVAYQFGDAVYSDAGKYLGVHLGSDKVNPNGGPVVAAHDGVVTMVKDIDAWNDALSVQLWVSGISVVVQAKTDKGSQVCTIYGHGATGSVKVVPGQEVTAGQELFTAGCTGFCRARHLHFGVIVGGTGPLCEGGKWLDPETIPLTTITKK